MELRHIIEEGCKNLDEMFYLLTSSLDEVDYYLEELGSDEFLFYRYLGKLETYFLENAKFYRWSDYNEKYQNNTYLYGIEYNGTRVATGYTGIAGCYWQCGYGRSYWLEV